MIKRVILLSAVCLAFLTIGAERPQASSSCYTSAQAEAEQAIRIHSELMVIGLNCQNMRMRGKNLYLQYKDFTFTHANLFAQYEEELMGYYRQRGDRNPEASLNTMRTALANQVSSDAARMKPDQFCNRYAARIPQVSQMGQSDLRRWAATTYSSRAAAVPLCH